MRRRKKLLCLLLAGVMAWSLSGCTNSTTEKTEEAGGNNLSEEVDDTTLRVAINTDITTLDYAHNYTIANFHVIDNINDFLLYFDQNGEVQPNLCTSWEAVDETTYVYQIRNDAYFSDGTQMTVDDVVFSMERIMDPEVASDMNWAYKNVASIEATGEWEVTVRLSQPDACWQYVPATPGGQITSKAYYEEHKDNFGNADGLTIGTGAYKIDKWTTGSEIVLSKNEYYWGEEPEFEKVIITVISDESAMAMAMDSGQLDFLVLNSMDMIDTYENSQNCTVHAADGIGSTLLSFNCSNGACMDENLRKAIASAVDVASLTESQFGDYAQSGTALPFGSGLYVLDPEEWEARADKMEAYEFNLEKAKEYLDKSDYDGSNLQLLLIEGNNAYANVAQAIQASCATIGINIEIQKVTSSEYYANAYGNSLDENGKRTYDMMINRWVPDYVDPAGDLVVFYDSNNAGAGGANYAAYSNSEVDALLAQQSSLVDNKERSELMLQACEIAAEESPYKSLYYSKTVSVTSNRVDYELPGFYLYSLFYKDFKLAQ